ncbi:hypothetical protein AO263_30325 [Pseudomonas sp. NZIPFR-PS5]|nr:hypothetical protein AO263_30325 [Pseudomonas sp. NZIPFR-PS5]
MKLLGIDHVQIEALDLEKTVAFWQEILGLNVVDMGIRLGLRWAIVSNGKNFSLSIHETFAADNKPGPRITHFGIVVEDFQGFRAALMEKDVKVDMVNVYDASRSYYFYDPNNHKIEVSEVWGGGL